MMLKRVLPVAIVSAMMPLLLSHRAEAQLIPPNLGEEEVTSLPRVSFFGEGGLQGVESGVGGTDNPLAQFFARAVPRTWAQLFIVGNVAAGLDPEQDDLDLASVAFRNTANTGMLIHAEAQARVGVPFMPYFEYAFQRYAVDPTDAGAEERRFDTATWDAGVRIPIMRDGTGGGRFSWFITPHYQLVQVTNQSVSDYRAYFGADAADEFHGFGAQVAVQLNDFTFEWGWQNALGIGEGPKENEARYVLRVSATGHLFDPVDGS